MMLWKVNKTSSVNIYDNDINNKSNIKMENSLQSFEANDNIDTNS